MRFWSILGMFVSMSAFGFPENLLTPPQIFAEHQVSHPEQVKIDKQEEGGLPCGPAYFVDLAYAGKYEGQDYEIRFSMTTKTKEHMDRIFSDLQKFYPTKGLPPCLMGEGFWATFYDYERRFITYQPELRGTGQMCDGGEVQETWTRCVDSVPLYPKGLDIPFSWQVLPFSRAMLSE
jgi:hypothetical protein